MTRSFSEALPHPQIHVCQLLGRPEGAQMGLNARPFNLLAHDELNANEDEQAPCSTVDVALEEADGDSQTLPLVSNTELMPHLPSPFHTSRPSSLVVRTTPPNSLEMRLRATQPNSMDLRLSFSRQSSLTRSGEVLGSQWSCSSPFPVSFGSAGLGPSPFHANPGGERPTQRHDAASLKHLHACVEQLMKQDGKLAGQISASIGGISSLAKETNRLSLSRDATGATVINQYVVVKTLGRGSFGKVKLCLNTLDGKMYAVKMLHRTHLVKQLQKSKASLRRRVPRSSSGEGLGRSEVISRQRSTYNNVPLGSSNSNTLTGFTPRSTSFAVPACISGDYFPNSGGSHARSSPRMSHGSMSREQHLPDGVTREIAVMKKMDHCNLVKLFEVIDPPCSNYLILVMEYMDGGVVQETKGTSGFEIIPEATALDYFQQTCVGLDYLHYNNVVHGDLKPENLLLSSSGHLKIGDFGSSRIIDDTSQTSKLSFTPAFQAPEAFAHNAEAPNPFALDIWALGICLYCFVFGRLPFTGACAMDISHAVATQEPVYPEGVVSDACIDLLKRLLVKDPEERIRLQDVLQHPWVTQFGMLMLPSIRALAEPPQLIQVSRADQASAIDRSSLVSMLRVRLKEVAFAPGEYLYHEGAEAHTLFMIMSGVVELTTHNLDHIGALYSTGAGRYQTQGSLIVDMDESLEDMVGMLGGVEEELAATTEDGRLHIGKHQAHGLYERVREALVHEDGEAVIGVRGPGRAVGEVSGQSDVPTLYTCSARARDHVVAVKLTEESFFKALLTMLGTDARGKNYMHNISAALDSMSSNVITSGVLPELLPVNSAPRSQGWCDSPNTL